MDSEAFGAQTGSSSSSRVLSLLLLITGALILAVYCEISVSWMVILVSPILCFHISMLRTSLTLIYLLVRKYMSCFNFIDQNFKSFMLV